MPGAGAAGAGGVVTTLLFDGGPWNGRRLEVEGRPDSWVVKVATVDGLATGGTIVITDVVYGRRDTLQDFVDSVNEKPVIVMIPEGRRRKRGTPGDPRRN